MSGRVSGGRGGNGSALRPDCLRTFLCPLRGGSNGHADRDLAGVPSREGKETSGGSVIVCERGHGFHRPLRAFVYSLLLVALFMLAGCKPKASSEPKAAPATAAPMPLPPASQLPSAAPDSTTKPSRPSGPIEFTDVTSQAGIHFKHNSGAFGKKYLPETWAAAPAFSITTMTDGRIFSWS